MRAEIAKYTQR